MTDILHYRRRMSREVIRKLASRFSISQELLNKPYNLASAARIPRQKQHATKVPEVSRRLTDGPLIKLLEERAGKASVAKLKDGKEITIWNIRAAHRIADPCAFLMVNLNPTIPGTNTPIIFTSEIKELMDRESGERIFQADW